MRTRPLTAEEAKELNALRAEFAAIRNAVESLREVIAEEKRDGFAHKLDDAEARMERLRSLGTARGFRAETCAMDKGYDNNRVYAECHDRDCDPIVPLRKRRIDPNVRVPRSTDTWRDLYRRRSAVEREFGRLKHEFGLAHLRVRSLARVRLHSDLCILSRLALALERSRAVSLTA